MKKLIDILWSLRQRELFAADLLVLVEQHVASRGGLRGIGIRAGLALLKAGKPDLLPRAINKLAPEFIAALQPLYEQFQSGPDGDFSVFLQKNAGSATERLLSVTDARIESSSSPAIRSAYARMRSFAGEEVQLAVPAIGQLIRGYL